MNVLLRLSFWAATVFAFVMAITPRTPEVLDGVSDKYQHMLAFAVLGVLAALAYRRTPYWRLFIGLALFGGLIELVQLIPALNRDGDLVDWAVDMAAAATALAAIALARKLGPADRF